MKYIIIDDTPSDKFGSPIIYFAHSKQEAQDELDRMNLENYNPHLTIGRIQSYEESMQKKRDFENKLSLCKNADDRLEMIADDCIRRIWGNELPEGKTRDEVKREILESPFGPYGPCNKPSPKKFTKNNIMKGLFNFLEL